MKNLQVIIMALMLCTIGTSVARSELVAGYPFDGSLCDCSGNNYDGQWCSLIGSYSSDVPPGFGGQSLCLDGTQCVELPLGAANPLDYSASSSIVMWFKVPALPSGTGALLFSSARDDSGDNHALSLFLTGDGEIRLDMFWVATVVGDIGGLDDGTWHHVASVFDAGTGYTTLYLDGVEDGSNDDIDQTIPNIADNTILIGATMNEEFPAEEGVGPLVGCVDNVGIFDHALTEGEVQTAMDEPICCCGSCPFYAFEIDPNVMTVYEEGETIGDFDVSLDCEPTGVVTVTVEPNDIGANDDFVLVGASGGDPKVYLTFDTNNWDVPQTVVFQAVDDDLEEGPDIDESHKIVFTTASADPNWDGRTTYRTVTVQDNDYADILFRVTPSRGGPKINVTGPVRIWERVMPAGEKWRRIGFQLQVKPKNFADPCNPATSVKLNAEVTGDIVGDNLPTTDVTLPFVESDDPNGFTFTSTTSSNGLPGGCPDHDPASNTTCWNVDQNIKIWGTDDDVLQALDATTEGDQNYQATLVVTVIDGGGYERYQWTEIEDPCSPEIVVGLERTVEINIEDNECGAFGISYLDIGNPNAFTDPNFRDENGNPLPDCYIDIYDIVEMAAGWLRCTNPQDENCQPML
jgi:hypothetical protein